jgi:hypothetical protein
MPIDALWPGAQLPFPLVLLDPPPHAESSAAASRVVDATAFISSSVFLASVAARAGR